MASSDNLIATATATAEPWGFRSAFESSWISQAYARDTEILTKALHQSISNNNNLVKLQTQSLTSSGGSETDSVSKPPTFRNATPPVTGKITKRKSRASKRSPTTFITADPENFRQMVQQVTGIRFSGGPGPVGSLLKPEPQRPRPVQQTACLLSTLDTSAFLLDHHQQQLEQIVGQDSVEVGPSDVVAGVGGPGFDFDGFSGFPTLESWN